MAIADVLDGAASVIERDGWCRGTATDRNGHHCLNGAIRVYVHEHVGMPIILINQSTMVFASYLPNNDAIKWNDQQTDKRAVCRKLRAVAKRIRKENA